MLKRLLITVAIGAGLVFITLAMFQTRLSLATSSTIVLSAVYYDTYLPNQPEESFRLRNVSTAPVSLTNWIATDGEGTITLTGVISPGEQWWIAKTAISFTLEFGYPPAFEYSGNSDPTVPDLARSGTVALADAGDQLILKDETGAIVDSVVWGTGTLTGTDWSGVGVGVGVGVGGRERSISGKYT